MVGQRGVAEELAAGGDHRETRALDDGVDVLEPSLQGKLIDGKTLSYDLPLDSEPTEQREHAFWESSGGHGTVMANSTYNYDFGVPLAEAFRFV